jgi:hypothetical protein
VSSGNCIDRTGFPVRYPLAVYLCQGRSTSPMSRLHGRGLGPAAGGGAVLRDAERAVGERLHTSRVAQSVWNSSPRLWEWRRLKRKTHSSKYASRCSGLIEPCKVPMPQRLTSENVRWVGGSTAWVGDRMQRSRSQGARSGCE